MSKNRFALGAIFGAVIGAAAGILTAKKSGKETIAEFKAKRDTIKADIAQKAEAAKDKAEGAVEDVKAEATDLKSRTERAIEAAKKGFNSKK
jgi:gas vesicle protein